MNHIPLGKKKKKELGSYYPLLIPKEVIDKSQKQITCRAVFNFRDQFVKYHGTLIKLIAIALFFLFCFDFQV